MEESLTVNQFVAGPNPAPGGLTKIAHFHVVSVGNR